jgi:hypothetical protein
VNLKSAVTGICLFFLGFYAGEARMKTKAAAARPAPVQQIDYDAIACEAGSIDPQCSKPLTPAQQKQEDEKIDALVKKYKTPPPCVSDDPKDPLGTLDKKK